MRKFLLAASVVMTFLLPYSATAQTTTVEYDSTPYIKQQYGIIKGIFHEFEVSLNNQRDIKIIIPNHYGFATGKSNLTRKVKDELRELSKVLNKYNESTIKVVGHTDNVGSMKSNKVLSEKRAMAVRNILTDSKVAPQRISMLGEGEELPRCTNDTANGRECNRRVELIITVEPYLY